MNKPLVYKILYYICFVLTVVVWIITSNLFNIFGINIEMGISAILGIINLIFVIVFSIKLIKNKLEKINILFPILHLLFSLIVIVLAIFMNNKLIIPNMHFGYYISFILFNYLLLNIYSNLSFVKIKK